MTFDLIDHFIEVAKYKTKSISSAWFFIFIFLTDVTDYIAILFTEHLAAQVFLNKFLIVFYVMSRVKIAYVLMLVIG